MTIDTRRTLAGQGQRVFLAVVLVLSSALAMAVLAARVLYSGTGGYVFMAWNLFLAWVPMALAVPVAFVRPRGRAGGAALLALAFLWLLFYPNAPYLVTDLQHLHPDHGPSVRPLHVLAGVSPGRGVPLWYDVVLLALFAWNGLLLAFVSLRLVQQAVAERLGARWGWAAVVAVCGLGGFGITLGRFQRWNSWDLFARPAAVVADVAGRVLNPLGHPRTTAATVLLATFLLLAYLAVTALAAAGPGYERRAESAR